MKVKNIYIAIKMIRSVFVCLLCVSLIQLCFIQGPAKAQNLNDTLNKLSQTAGKAYVAPLVNGFGANLNSGWFHKAPGASIFGLNIELGIVGSGALLGTDQKEFSIQSDFQFSLAEANLLAGQVTPDPLVRGRLAEVIVSQTYTVGISGPTAIGSKDEQIMIRFLQPITDPGPGGVEYEMQPLPLGVTGLLDWDILPHATPQLTVGTVYGTQAVIRYFPKIKLSDEIGKIEYLGYGLQHNPLVWLPETINMPFDISAGFFMQKLTAGDDLFECKTTAFSLNVSKRLGRIISVTPYAGVMIEKSEMSFSYTYGFEDSFGNPQEDTVKFELEGENTSRFIIGTALKLPGLSIAIDYNFGKQRTVSAGLFFGL